MSLLFAMNNNESSSQTENLLETFTLQIWQGTPWSMRSPLAASTVPSMGRCLRPTMVFLWTCLLQGRPMGLQTAPPLTQKATTSQVQCVVSQYQFELAGPRITQVGSAGFESQTTPTSFPEEQQLTLLHDSIVVTRRKFTNDFDDVDEALVHQFTVDQLLEYVERQRLIYMPHRGSHWDKVLKWAEYFALQISAYVTAVGPFVLESKIAAQLVWIASRSLLRVVSWVLVEACAEIDPARPGKRSGSGNDLWRILPSRSLDRHASAKQCPTRRGWTYSD